jgi:uncharacterized protein (DUF2062 family)
LPPDFVERIFSEGFEVIAPVLPRMMLGSVPLGIVTGLVFYFVTRLGVRLYQRSRRERLAKRQRAAQGGSFEAE